MKTGFPRQTFEQYSNIKFNENPSGGSRVVPSGQDGQNDEANTVIAFRNFANAPKKMGFTR